MSAPDVSPQSADDTRFAEPPEAGPHPLKQKRVLLPLGALVLVLSLPFIHYALRGEARTTTTVPFTDDFERAELGPNYFSTGGHWRIVDGWLYSPGVKNNPAWLQAKLPRNAVVEFDVRSEDSAGDVKCEIFGNGRDHASGYIAVFGGWNNTISTLARLDEHGKDRKERRDKKVEKGRTYRFKLERSGNKLTWYIDGEKFLDWDDNAPLEGSGHDRFGFSSWATDVYFDNLSVRSLE